MNGWAILSFCPRGSTALNLCSGSGSFMEACMNLGRSCISIEIDGNFCSRNNYIFSLDYQYSQARRRMELCFVDIQNKLQATSMDYPK